MLVAALKRAGILLSIIAVVWYVNNRTTVHAEGSDETIDPSKFKLTFGEEFDKLDVSAWGPGTRWIAHTPWSGDFGGAKFGNPGQNSPFAIVDGALEITARRDENGAWKSGLLASMSPKGIGFAQKFGYFEMRARLPTGPGVWPAFWLIGKDRTKATAEIDVIEYYGDKPGAYSSVVHVWRRDGEEYRKGTRVKAFVTDDPAQFHTYGVKVDHDFIKVYYDRKLVWQTETRPEHRQPMYPLVNLALVDGPTNQFTPDPSVMTVDYIRVYQVD